MTSFPPRGRIRDTTSKVPSTLVALLSLAALGSCSSPTSGPDASTPASVAVAPATALLVSIGDTVELTATVRNGSSQPLSTSVNWSVIPSGVVSVDASGRVVALANGEATITASTGAVSGDAAVTVQQVVDSLGVSGDAQAADVGAPLDSAIVLTLLDARGNAVAGAPVAFTVASGGGSSSTASTTADSDGSATTSWTLGDTAGIQDLDVVAGFSDEATRRLTANGYPLDATTLVLYAGDGQSELAQLDLAAPLQVQALDSLGNGVPAMLVSFAVDGDATLEAPEAYTDLDGVASVGLTLGTALGTYTITATVADSLTVTGLPLTGSPVTLQAAAVAYTVSAVTDLTVGDTVTLSGTGFHPTLQDNSIVLGGTAATILAGSQTELTFEVPSFGCTPERGMDLEVSRAGYSATQPVAVTPAGALTLAVGERKVLSEADAFCLQFLAASNDEFVVGLTSTSWFDGGASFSMTGLDSIGPFPASPASRSTSSSTASSPTVSTSSSSAEFRLREYERDLTARVGTDSLLPAGSSSTTSDAGSRDALGSAPALASASPAAAPAAAPPMEGDLLQLRLPDLRADPCTDYVPISAEVFSVGARLALATSATLPGPQDPLIVVLLEAANTLHAEFGDTGIDLIMGFLGLPAGWTSDSRITVVLTPEVSAMGLPLYASAVDQLPRSVCPSSDEGNYVYASIPNAATTAQLAAVLAAAPPDLAHQIAHIVQWTRRLSTGGNLLPSWIAEGQAELIVEHVGLTLAGLGSQQDLGSAVLGLPGVSQWIPQRFDRLAYFQGWDGATGTVTGAPEQCSLFGFLGVSSPCAPEAGPGAAWSFMRYLSDRFGPSGPGGEPGLHQAIIDLSPTEDPIAQLETMLGVTLPDLVVDWAGMLYADGRLTPAQAPSLQMPSWRLLEMIPAGPKRLNPATFGFVDFARSGTVVGGGTAYSLVTSAGAHGSLALSVDDGAGGVIPSALRPRLWVLRMR